MGWNQGWEILEHQVVPLYDLLGANFTGDIAKAILKPFIDTDMDEGGKDYNYFSKDGKEMEEIIVSAIYPGFDAENYKPDDPDIDDDLFDDAHFSKEELNRHAYQDQFYKLLRNRQFWSK